VREDVSDEEWLDDGVTRDNILIRRVSRPSSHYYRFQTDISFGF
jgi:hypothetical protein